MENMTFEELIKINCFSKEASEQKQAAELLEQRYCCEIRCADMDESVRFAHHARGCTIVAAKLSKNVVIFQKNSLRHRDNTAGAVWSYRILFHNTPRFLPCFKGQRA